MFNVIHVAKEDAGPRVSEIIAHPLVRKIAVSKAAKRITAKVLTYILAKFTGSDRVGKIIATEAAKWLKPCVFELGGKCPAVVIIVFFVRRQGMTF